MIVPNANVHVERHPLGAPLLAVSIPIDMVDERGRVVEGVGVDVITIVGLN